MITALHEAVAARAQAGGLPVSAAAVAEIDRLLTQERVGARWWPRSIVNEIACAAAPLGRAREGGAASEAAAPPPGGRAA